MTLDTALAVVAVVVMLVPPLQGGSSDVIGVS